MGLHVFLHLRYLAVYAVKMLLLHNLFLLVLYKLDMYMQQDIMPG